MGWAESFQDEMAKIARVKVGPPPSPNRKKWPYEGTIDFQGVKILVENKKGSTRSGTDDDGKPWHQVMKHHYGEIPGVPGADGDDLDAFIGPDEKSNRVYVIHQKKPGTMQFDEDKVMLGFTSALAARRGYVSNYNRRGFFGGMTPLNFDEFVAQLRHRHDSKHQK
jgi:hypothetical protein